MDCQSTRSKAIRLSNFFPFFFMTKFIKIDDICWSSGQIKIVQHILIITFSTTQKNDVYKIPTKFWEFVNTCELWVGSNLSIYFILTELNLILAQLDFNFLVNSAIKMFKKKCVVELPRPSWFWPRWPYIKLIIITWNSWSAKDDVKY